MTLPHRFPFLLVDRVEGERAVLALTIDAAWLRGAAGLQLPLLVEIAAQAAACLAREPEAGSGGQFWLGGVEEFTCRAGVGPGDRLEIAVGSPQRLGPAARIAATIRVDGETVASGRLLLVRSGG